MIVQWVECDAGETQVRSTGVRTIRCTAALSIGRNVCGPGAEV